MICSSIPETKKILVYKYFLLLSVSMNKPEIDTVQYATARLFLCHPGTKSHHHRDDKCREKSVSSVSASVREYVISFSQILLSLNVHPCPFRYLISIVLSHTSLRHILRFPAGS